MAKVWNFVYLQSYKWNVSCFYYFNFSTEIMDTVLNSGLEHGSAVITIMISVRIPMFDFSSQMSCMATCDMRITRYIPNEIFTSEFLHFYEFASAASFPPLEVPTSRPFPIVRLQCTLSNSKRSFLYSSWSNFLYRLRLAKNFDCDFAEFAFIEEEIFTTQWLWFSTFWTQSNSCG